MDKKATHGSKNAKRPKLVQMTFAVKQKGPKTCSQCGFNFFTCNTNNKISQHKRYHNEYLNGYEISTLKISKLKEIGKVINSHCVTINQEERKLSILLVSYRDTTTRKIIGTMLKMINDRWLNTPTEENKILDKVVLVISQPNTSKSTINESYIVGITTTIPGPLDGFSLDIKTSNVDRLKAMQLNLGVSRIFVSQEYRRKGLALEMLESLRCHSIYGVALKKEEIGFSQPSGAGTLLISQWMSPATYIPVYDEV